MKSDFHVTWIGHATVVVKMDGFTFITDPIWAANAAPISYTQYRIIKPPCRIEDLPKLDFGVISHNHYDHLDEDAIKNISKINPKMTWFVPKGLKSIVKRNVLSFDTAVVELEW